MVIAEPIKPAYIEVAQRDALVIGQKIWMNESSAKIEGLTSWNQGEHFASLGIGHFIWYPETNHRPYTETFPDLLKFLKERNYTLPVWLQNITVNPWPNREAFLAAKDTPQMTELRQFMLDSIPDQVQFIIRRLEQALPVMLQTLSNEAERALIKTQFYRVAQTPQGVYALLDYVNFKGEGVALTERYQEQGWGLLQVLSAMTGNTASPLQEFADAADVILTRRVQNAPAERQESRWLLGWRNRLKTYLEPLTAKN
ncbi:hypothetical protein TPSD3_16865 [Thioflexithrix psekupsensis]|uniref:Uncharacterized protein n=1 Tax=Thioflexithrix psekupsensis TaxID=1570016 RepID=A0A251X4F8_9GAMM|nr:hypothetical protein TPSD3_16865 [Thioflexithrix psekupsensis]